MSANSGDHAQLGIALDGTLLVAAWRSAREAGAWRTHVVPCDATLASIGPALAQVADAMARSTDARPMAIAATLLRPLASSRTVAFPAMKRDELRTVLERDWTRHAIAMRPEPHAVAVRAIDATSWRAAFAPAATLDALDAAVRVHGWMLRDLRTADDALAAVALHTVPNVARIDDAIVVLCGGSGASDVVRLRRGATIAGRQFVAGTAGEIVAFVRPSASGRAAAPATIFLLGDAERSTALARELGREGLHAQHASLARLPGDSPAALLAGAATQHAATLPLVSPAERATRVRRARTVTWRLAAAVVLLVALGLVIENARLGRELAVVTRARAAVAAQVGDAVARRADLESATEFATALAEHEANASHAAAALAAITLALPERTALSALQITGDSVTIEGESDRSADVYAALRSAAALTDVRLAGPLRQERQADGEPVERFAFVARLSRGAR
ncbi:MAG TPA: PilN domain-containing protein [Gemmatimonadaceae bacterium]|nr:PilN domain-containing protein [Gemmatimonadaceae bacterium]